MSSSSTLIPPPDISPTPPFPSDFDIIWGPTSSPSEVPSQTPDVIPTTSASASNPPASQTSSLTSTPLLTSEPSQATGVAQVQSSGSSRLDKRTIAGLSVALGLISLAATVLCILYCRNRLRRARKLRTLAHEGFLTTIDAFRETSAPPDSATVASRGMQSLPRAGDPKRLSARDVDQWSTLAGRGSDTRGPLLESTSTPTFVVSGNGGVAGPLRSIPSYQLDCASPPRVKEERRIRLVPKRVSTRDFERWSTSVGRGSSTRESLLESTSTRTSIALGNGSAAGSSLSLPSYHSRIHYEDIAPAAQGILLRGDQYLRANMSTIAVAVGISEATSTITPGSRRPMTTVSTQVDSASSTTVTQRVTVSASAAPEASLVSQLISSQASDKRTIQTLTGTLASVLGVVALYLGYRVIMKAKARRVKSTTGESYGRVGAPGSLLSPTPYPGFRYGQERGVPPSSPFTGVEEQSMVSLTSHTLASNGGVPRGREQVIVPAARTIHSSTSSYAGSTSTPPSYRSSDDTNTEGGRTTPTPDDPFADTSAYESARSQGAAGPPSPPAFARTTSSVAWTDISSVATLPSYRSFEGAEYGRAAATAAA
ncbi:hypothetical protein CCMSSC00406_0006020 [Pleurotus cornucopiae]|uniref:Uncharacterized protein n=1 Tax=Pleurotus cornucopiae TaxID=5321 RepID=A0ACB7IQ58_PLECO|nr:hypothetical protein CCMSSC00406_0006020 [Pleurotus cornucopiae]